MGYDKKRIYTQLRRKNYHNETDKQSQGYLLQLKKSNLNKFLLRNSILILNQPFYIFKLLDLLLLKIIT